MTCRHCGTDIAAKALICYKCGRATTEPRVPPPADGPLFEQPSRPRMRIVTVVAAIVVAALLLVGGWWLVVGG